MLTRRTDLAVEAKEIWKESAEKTTKLEGVEARDLTREKYPVNYVKILDDKGAKALGKPVGTYITLNLEGFAQREEDFFGRAVRALAAELAPLLQLSGEESVLVVGLGNGAITPDAVGPLTMEQIMVTRHLATAMPEQFGQFRKVSAVASGVLGTTGIESAELIAGVVERAKPDRIIAVDALASRRLSRVCTTIQLADTGIVPGSGVGNKRAALNRESLGIPVVAIGVPTVVDAGTLAADIVEEAGVADLDPEALASFGGNTIVTLKEIDLQVRDISKVIGYGINMALQKDMSVEDINSFLS
ncbi:GPR endopeptidase [Papillibacter cinnamivorans]|uniref:Germination protease n=1 Tax=Papillibacter cinnamivorans DSM 12816 TaxID=1122930 RepID=A0A1W2AAN3_9FIRM|nr:GPR endopeptidase [Papillibacter cinnamivorans]SMC57680.1 spore protease [Papillibacter cinnamivorans DSM 12816]